MKLKRNFPRRPVRSNYNLLACKNKSVKRMEKFLNCLLLTGNKLNIVNIKQQMNFTISLETALISF